MVHKLFEFVQTKHRPDALLAQSLHRLGETVHVGHVVSDQVAAYLCVQFVSDGLSKTGNRAITGILQVNVQRKIIPISFAAQGVYELAEQR